MASYLDKFQVNTAVDESSKMDLSCQHITTADWMQLNPIYVKEMVPNEKLAVNAQTFTRMAPMPVPTFGRANVHERAFFVPYRTVWKGWTDFITDTVHVASDQTSAIASSVPSFTMRELVNAFVYPDYSTNGLMLFSDVIGFTDPTDVGEIVPDEWDLVTPVGWIYSHLNMGEGSLKYKLSGTTALTNVSSELGYAFKFNNKGRQALKILNSLGYQLVASNSSEWIDYTMSALPLLSFFKVYVDWYYPSQYYGDVTRTLIEGLLNRDTSDAYSLNAQELSTIFALIGFVNYDSDYFVSAFDNPQGPTASSFSTVTIPDITKKTNGGGADTNTYVTNGILGASNSGNRTGGNGTPQLGSGIVVTSGVNTGTMTQNSITQYALTALKKLTDYMKRHQLVGARAMDRYLARFGKNLTAEKLNRSLYIGAKSFPLQIGDVMSQSDTTGAQLGAYAGKGLGYGETTFGYETDEYGLFILTCSIVPTVGYYQGIDRNVMHLNRLDYWTPEFDQLGNQAIGSAELYVPTKPSEAVYGSDILTGLTTNIFGYAPRYAEYKCGRDRLTGDYRLPRLSTAGDISNSWHLFREFTNEDFVDDATQIKHSVYFVEGDDASQYNRIFYNTEDTADHFYLIHNFDVASYSNMAKLYDTYEFDDKGKTITEEVNGVKVN